MKNRDSSNEILSDIILRQNRQLNNTSDFEQYFHIVPFDSLWVSKIVIIFHQHWFL